MTSEVFGRFRLEELIGVGGMGEVWRAVDTHNGRQVALKRLRPSVNIPARDIVRFRREAEALDTLRSPHIMPALDYGEINERFFIAMPLIEGSDLARILAIDGRLTVPRALDVLDQLADALDTAHEAGIIHRDIKPSNILIVPRASGRDIAYVIDFGIARIADLTSVTPSNQAIGTARYMAPEQFSNEGDVRSDVYAVACVLYECLTGSPPFVAPHGVYEAAYYWNAHCSATPPIPSHVFQDIPSALDRVVTQGLSKLPEDRFQSVGGLASAARRATSEFATHEVKVNADGLTARLDQRPSHSSFRRVLILGVAACLLIAAASFFLLRPPNDGESQHSSVTYLPLDSAASSLFTSPDGKVYAAGSRVNAISGLPNVISAIPVNNANGEYGGTALRDGSVFLYSSSFFYFYSGGDTQIAGREVGTDESVFSAATSFNFGKIYIVTRVEGGSNGAPHELVILNSSTGKLSKRVALGIPIDPTGPIGPQDLIQDPDGRYVYVTSSGGSSATGVEFSNAIAQVDTQTDKPVWTTALRDFPLRSVLSPDGKELYVVTATAVQAVETDHGALLGSIPLVSPAVIAVSADGQRLYAVSGSSKSISVIDIASRRVVDTVDLEDSPLAIAVGGNGRIYVLLAGGLRIGVVDHA